MLVLLHEEQLARYAFDTEFDTNAHIECIRNAIAVCPADDPNEAHIMAYLLTDTNPDDMMYPPWEPPDFLKLPKMEELDESSNEEVATTSTMKAVQIDGELFMKPLHWKEGDD